MSDVALMTATTTPRMDEDLQTWVAALGESRGVGVTKAGALRDLANDLERRNQAAQRGDLQANE